MRYVNALEVIPEELLKEVQKYVSGGLIYVPQLEEKRKLWGESTGSRQDLMIRNAEIKQKFQSGIDIEELAITYSLAYETIKKIVYKKNQ